MTLAAHQSSESQRGLPSRCDVVVIGAGMGGLTSAALLAKHGLDVCVLEAERRPGGYLAGFQRRRFRFDTAIHWLNQCGPGGLVRRVLDHIAPGAPETAPLERIRRYKGQRFDYLLTRDPDRMAGALQADFPRDERGIRAFFDLARELGRTFATVSRHARTPSSMTWRERARVALPAAVAGLSILRHSRATERALPRYFSSPRLRELFCSEEDLVSCLMPIGWAYEGDYQVPPTGGSQAFPRWLCAQMRGFGGQLAYRSRVTRILLEDGAVAGVRVEPRSKRGGAPHEIRCKHVVAASDLCSLYEELLPPGAVKPSAVRRLETADLYDSAVTLSVGLDVSPARLGFDRELVVLTRQDVRREEHRGPDPHKVALNVLAPSLRDPTLAPDGKGTLTVYAAARLDDADRWKTGPDLERGPAYKDYKRRYADVLLERVEDALAPGLGRHIEVCDVATPVTHLRYTRNRGGTIMGARATGRNIRARVAHYETPVRNLVLGGHWADYGGGVPVAVRAGANSALLVLRRERPEAFAELKELLDA